MSPNKNAAPAVRLSAAAGFAAVLIAAATAPACALPASAPASALSAAKTIQVHETSVLFDQYGGTVPQYHVVLRIKRPGAVKAVLIDDRGKTPGRAGLQYFDDGATETV